MQSTQTACILFLGQQSTAKTHSRASGSLPSRPTRGELNSKPASDKHSTTSKHSRRHIDSSTASAVQPASHSRPDSGCTFSTVYRDHQPKRSAHNSGHKSVNSPSPSPTSFTHANGHTRSPNSPVSSQTWRPGTSAKSSTSRKEHNKTSSLRSVSPAIAVGSGRGSARSSPKGSSRASPRDSPILNEGLYFKLSIGN